MCQIDLWPSIYKLWFKVDTEFDFNANKLKASLKGSNSYQSAVYPPWLIINYRWLHNYLIIHYSQSWPHPHIVIAQCTWCCAETGFVICGFMHDVTGRSALPGWSLIRCRWSVRVALYWPLSLVDKHKGTRILLLGHQDAKSRFQIGCLLAGLTGHDGRGQCTSHSMTNIIKCCRLLHFIRCNVLWQMSQDCHMDVVRLTTQEINALCDITCMKLQL